MTMRLSLLTLTLVLAAGCPAPPSPGTSPGAGEGEGEGEGEGQPTCDVVNGTPDLKLERVVDGFQFPTDLKFDSAGRMFVVEQLGRIWIVQDGIKRDTPFLDIRAKVSTDPSSYDERGLMGIALHPDFATNGRFFVHYTGTGAECNADGGCHTHVAEFHTGDDPDTADVASEVTLLNVPHEAFNHNGGGIAFGPDKMLYVTIGDGGAACGTFEHAQDRGSKLAKLMRLDVDHGVPYAIPTDNPFGDEVWIWGLRNPWRFSWDRQTSDLYIADVGQDAIEWVDVLPPTSVGGENFGWPMYEGSQCPNPSCGNRGDCATPGLSHPVFEYPHDGRCSITGGFSYRGCRMPGYGGTYFFADWCDGSMGSFKYDGSGAATDVKTWPTLQTLEPSTFGQDNDGELYVVDYSSGEIFRIGPQP